MDQGKLRRWRSASLPPCPSFNFYPVSSASSRQPSPKVKVLADRVVYRGGGVGEVHQTTLRFSSRRVRTWSYCVKAPFVMVLALHGNRLVLVRQNRYPQRRNTWEVVKGGVERGESALAAARRELMEETGFSAKRVFRIGRFMVAPGYFNQPGTVYLAQQLTPGVPHPESNGEILEVMLASPSRVRQMIARGDLYDSTTFAGLLMARKFFPL